MAVRMNDEGVLEADFFGMQVKTNKVAAMFALMPGEDELDYVESQGEAVTWTALVFDEGETEVLRKLALAAQKLADDQETANLAIKMVEILDAMKNYGQVEEGKSISEEEAKARWAEGS